LLCPFVDHYIRFYVSTLYLLKVYINNLIFDRFGGPRKRKQKCIYQKCEAFAKTDEKKKGIFQSKYFHCKCHICDADNYSDTVSITSNGKVIHKDKINCRIPMITYILKCEKCNEQYCGKSTNSLRKRLGSHVSDITINSGPTGKHHFRCQNTYFEAHIISAHTTVKDLEYAEAELLKNFDLSDRNCMNCLGKTCY